MSRKRRGARGRHLERLEYSGADWIIEQLESHPEGVHEIADPAVVLDGGLHSSVEAVYRTFGGGRFFHESLVLLPPSELRVDDGKVHIGEHAGDEIVVDPHGGVLRIDHEMGAVIPEGSRFDRWLAGVVDAEAYLLDSDGEFRDGLFDEFGELDDGAAMERERRILKRDPKAPGPRWRLAQRLLSVGQHEEARRCLEEVVEEAPAFAWAWYDLARASEGLGERGTASEEAEEAARCAAGDDTEGYFLAHAARLAEPGSPRRHELATQALAVDPELPRRHVEGARSLAGEDELQEALALLELALAIAPRDLTALDLSRRIRSSLEEGTPT